MYKPSAIVEYSRKMGGVDLSDQMMSYYHFLRRTCKWSTKLFLHLFGMLLLNVFVLNKKFGIKKQMTHYEFREIMAKELVRDGCQTLDMQHSIENMLLVEMNPSRLQGRHFLCKITKTVGEERIRPQVCRVCRVKKPEQHQGFGSFRKRKTVYKCDVCEIAMCAFPCFKVYHTAEKYQEAVDALL